MALWLDLYNEFVSSGMDRAESVLSPIGQHLHRHGVTVCSVTTISDGYRVKFSSRQPVAVAVKLGIKYVREQLGGEPDEVETLFYYDKGEFTITCI